VAPCSDSARKEEPGVHLMVLLLRLSGAALEFQDALDCPAAELVLKRLEEISPSSPAADWIAVLSEAEDGLSLVLRDRGGATLAARRLPRSADCSGTADYVAVTLAAWEAELSPAPPPAKLPSQAAPAVVLPPEPSGTAPLPGIGSHRLDVAALVLATGDGQGAGIAGEFGVDPAPLVTFALVEAPHTAPLGPGEVHWLRASLGLGGSIRWEATPWDLALRGFVLGALLDRWGSGYATNQGALSPDAGLGAGLRVLLPLGGGVRAVADLSVVVWPATQRIAVSGLPETFTLPPLQLFVGLGISHESGRP
jgi:hypothetical protein